MYDIRKISDYFREVHSRYYIDTNGIVYTSISASTQYFYVQGVRYNINKYKTLSKQVDSLLFKIEKTDYFVLNNQIILKRLSTRLRENNEVDVCLMRLNGNPSGNRYLISRLVAGCFIGEVKNKEVHHKDKDRKNNNVINLQILAFEEHRAKGNHGKNHFN